MIRFLARHKWLAGITLGVVAVTAVAGAFSAMRAEEGKPTVLAEIADDSSSSADADPRDRFATTGIGLKSAGDPAIEFPKALEGLVPAPFKLAADDASGSLWFAQFPEGAVSYRLNRYDVASAKLESFDLPVSPATELFSAIAVDPRGHLIMGYGSILVDFDPATSTYHQIDLGVSPANLAKLDGLDGTWVTDIAVGAGGEVYVARMNTAAITRVDLSKGTSTEIKIPESLVPVYRLSADASGIWMTSWGDLPGSTSQTGRLDTQSLEVQVVPVKTSSLLTVSDGSVIGATMPSAGLVRLAPDSQPALSTADLSGSLSGNWDFLAADHQSANVWMAGEGNTTVSSLDLGTGSVRRYQLPVYTMPYVGSCPRQEGCPETTVAYPRVKGLAVVRGDLYFSDVAFNRIGVIHAGQ